MKATVKDVFSIRSTAEYGRPGIVICFDSAADVVPSEGELLLVNRADGWMRWCTARDVRPLNEPSAGVTAIGLFLADLVKDDLPVGSTVAWSDGLPEESLVNQSVSAGT